MTEIPETDAKALQKLSPRTDTLLIGPFEQPYAVRVRALAHGIAFQGNSTASLDLFIDGEKAMHSDFKGSGSFNLVLVRDLVIIPDASVSVRIEHGNQWATETGWGLYVEWVQQI